MRLPRFALAFIALVLLAVVTACAARSTRDQARSSAVTVGEAVLAIDQLETQLATAQIPGYDATAQKPVSAAILKALHAARAYERATKAATASADRSALAQLEAAKHAVLTALDDVVAVVPASEAIRGPLTKAVNVARAALAAATARIGGEVPVQGAQLPASIPALLQLASVIASLIASGRSSIERIKAALSKEGATDEELDALDDRLTEAIDRREAGQA
ncbi:MAG TPA: hypothetical protein PK229_12090 [Rhodocyclaceae bacterium]|nr:hypothetical protein [Rhodocyclaceae bacterium]